MRNLKKFEMESLVKRIEALEEKLKREDSSNSKSVGREDLSVEDLILDTGLDAKMLHRNSLLIDDPSNSKETRIGSARQSFDSHKS